MNWKTQQFSSKNDKVLANAQGSERDLVIDILKKSIYNNVIIDYWHNQLR